jgi:hypothetical protein
MPSSPNRINTRIGSPGDTGSFPENAKLKENYTAIEYGNDHGSIAFGHIHKDGFVTSDVLLQASDGRHHITLDKDGQRKGWTTIQSPGNFSLKCGLDNVEDQDSLFLNAENGNIDIIATNGKLRIQATDIELVAVGEGGSKGNIRMFASENIEMRADNKITIDAKAMYKLASAGKAEITANSCMTMYASMIQGVTAAVTTQDSKVGGQSFQQDQLLA